MKVTVDAVVFAYIEKKLNVLLIKRTFDPFKGKWSLPGGFIGDFEDAGNAVKRKLKEETNIDLQYLEQLYTFTSVNRDPRERIISISYYVLINPVNHNLATNVHASEVKWFPCDLLKLPQLAFDHAHITQYARVRLANKCRYEPIGFELLPKQFSLTDLYDFYNAILGNSLDRRNFNRKINGYQLLKKTQHKTTGHVGRRAQLFEFDKEKYDQLLMKGMNFDI
jgi:8-oxo-dGTP diphosphatase